MGIRRPTGRVLLTCVSVAPQASLEDSERAALAKGVADVAFTSRSSAGPINVSRTGAPHRFTRDQFGDPAGPNPDA